MELLRYFLDVFTELKIQTITTRTFCLITPKQFVEKRRIYNQQLHELRKQWAVEHAEKQAILEEEKKYVLSLHEQLFHNAQEKMG